MAYGVIQFTPLMLLEFSGFGLLKLMRKANVSSTRTAQLRRRRLFDFVSPRLLGSTIVMYLAAIIVDLYVHDFIVDWTHDTVQRAMVLSATNLFFIAMGACLLHGQRLNPHQSFEDWSRHIRATLNSILYVSIAMSVFFMVMAADDVYGIDNLNATLLSIYFQVIVLLSMGHVMRNQRVEDMNFDVYKENGNAVT